MESFTTARKVIELSKKHGDKIDSIKTDLSDWSDDDGEQEKYKCIGDIFDDDQIAGYFFDSFQLIYSTDLYTVTDDDNKKYTKKYSEYDYTYNDDAKIKSIINKLRKPAAFGDILNESTTVNPTVRKGFDIDLTEKDCKIQVCHNLEEKVMQSLTKKTGMKNVIIKPYKLNIYEEGDFFSEHRDSPNENLLATIIVNIEGDTECFYVNNEQWINYSESYRMNVCIFYTDIVHEVKPVKKYRETLTFKVFKKITNEVPESISDDKTKQFMLRVNTNKQFGVLLQHGYTYTDVQCPVQNIPFKGLDDQLIQILKQLNLNYVIRPVIVKDVKRSKKYEYESNTDDDDDSNSDDDDDHYSNNEQYNGYSSEISHIHIYNLSRELHKLLSLNNEIIGEMPVYYIGKGFKVGGSTKSGLYTGNQYDGIALANIYLNMMLIVG